MTAAAGTAFRAAVATNRQIQADGLSWHVVEQGEGPPVLLVHGTAASTHSWRNVMPLLADRYRVVAVDLPGHGRTQSRGARDLNIKRMAAGLGALVQALGVSPVTVAGHSAGAAVLVEAAAHGQLAPRTVVSFNGAFYPFGGVAGSLFSPIAKLMAFNPLLPHVLSAVASRATVERLLRDTGSTPTADDVALYHRLLKQPGHVAAALGMMAAWVLSGMEAALARLDASCVFVAGDNDRSVPPATADRAAARCRQARALHVKEYGHLLHEETPALAADISAGRA